MTSSRVPVRILALGTDGSPRPLDATGFRYDLGPAVLEVCLHTSEWSPYVVTIAARGPDEGTRIHIAPHSGSSFSVLVPEVDWAADQTSLAITGAAADLVTTDRRFRLPYRNDGEGVELHFGPGAPGHAALYLASDSTYSRLSGDEGLGLVLFLGAANLVNAIFKHVAFTVADECGGPGPED